MRRREVNEDYGRAMEDAMNVVHGEFDEDPDDLARVTETQTRYYERAFILEMK